MLLSGIKCLIFGLGRGLLDIVMQFVKFGVVLLLAYMMALVIFNAWERSISISVPKRLTSESTTLKNRESTPMSNSNTLYPQLVEMLTMQSKESMKAVEKSQSDPTDDLPKIAMVANPSLNASTTASTTAALTPAESVTTDLIPTPSIPKSEIQRHTLNNELEEKQ